MIEQLDSGLYLLRTSDGALTPEPAPIVNSLLRVFKCPAGFLIEPIANNIKFGGYYLMAHAAKVTEISAYDLVVRTPQIVIYNAPGSATLAISAELNDLLKSILDDQ